jgi:acyl-CoA reductase-like NAD-dependent aldehyde dehydrogenase
MEETFGPVIPIVRAPDNDDELIALSNSTAFGLSSGVCTNDFRRMQKYIAGLKVGTVNIWEVPGYRIEMSLRRHQGQRKRLQGRRHRSHEIIHKRQNILPTMVKKR